MIWEAFDDYISDYKSTSVDQTYYPKTDEGTTVEDVKEFLEHHPKYKGPDDVIRMCDPTNFVEPLDRCLQKYQKAGGEILERVYEVDPEPPPEDMKGHTFTLEEIHELLNYTFSYEFSFFVKDTENMTIDQFPSCLTDNVEKMRKQYRRFVSLCLDK